MTLGRIGFHGRYDYGAIGPVTNLASRLSTRAAPAQVLIGPRVYAATEDDVHALPVGQLELKGFTRAMAVYEVESMVREGWIQFAEDRFGLDLCVDHALVT